MDNILQLKTAPRWYKVVLALWGPLSLVGGAAVAFYTLQESPSATFPIILAANAIQVILLGILIKSGLAYYSVKQLVKRLLLAFLLMAIVPIVFIVIDTGGEMSVGVLALIALLAISIPQIIYIAFFGLISKLFKSSSYLALVVSALVHVSAFGMLAKFFLQD